MKNRLFFAGIFGIALIFGLLVAGCDSDADDGFGGTTDGYYTVTFDGNGGNFQNTTGTHDYFDVGKGNDVTCPNNFYRDGYYLDGWNTDPEGTGSHYSVGESFTPTGDITLYAQWARNKLVFDGNGGTGEIYIEGETLTLPATVDREGSGRGVPNGDNLYREGYNFTGWSIDRNGGGETYSAGDTFYYDYFSEPVITLYAQWQLDPHYYEVTFDSNGGTDLIDSQVVPAGSSTSLPNGGESGDEYYYFAGWNTDPDGDGDHYLADDDFWPDDSITLYAQWARYVYTVTFSRGYYGSGTLPEPITVEAGSSIEFPDGGDLSRDGYFFNGWTTSIYGYSTGAHYDAGQEFTPTSSISLYPEWVILYTVTFSLRNGNGTVPDAITAKAGEIITLPDAENVYLDGYILNGWNTNSNLTASTRYDIGDPFEVTGNTTLYTHWIALYTVTFNSNFTSNEGSGSAPAAVSVKAGESFELPDAGSLSRVDRFFDGWSTSSYYGSGTRYNAGSSYWPTSSITLYAQWGSLYTVTFDSNNGGGSVPTQTVKQGSSLSLPSGNSLYRDGYEFKGWGIYTSGGTTYEAGTSYTPSNNVTLYAQWNPSPSSYTVTFDPNGGSGSASSYSGSVGNSQYIYYPSSISISRSGYSFDGWNTQANGKGDYYDSQIYFYPTGDITLYAQWILSTTYTVTFDLNGGTGGSVPAPQTSNSIYLNSSWTTSLIRSGYTFTGWNTQASGRGTHYNSNTYFYPSSNTTLYAEWKSTAPIVISFEPDATPLVSGTLSISQSSQTTATVTVANPEQYDSINWYITGTNVSGTGDSFTLSGANIAYNNTGSHLLVVEVVLNGVPYSRTVTFTVTN